MKNKTKETKKSVDDFDHVREALQRALKATEESITKWDKVIHKVVRRIKC